MITRRRFLANSSALAVATLGAAEALAQGGGLAQSGLVGTLEGSQVVTDPAAIPKSFKEAPELAELVKQGKLPPVAQRLPAEPLVLKPLKQVGRYGGTWRRGFVGPGDGENGNRIQASDKLLFWDYTGNKIIPSIAKSVVMSEDGKVTRVTLRAGMKWSDGTPFSADDFVFWFEDIYGNREIVPTGIADMSPGGKPGKIVKIDPTTVEFQFEVPYFLLMEMLAGDTLIGGGMSVGMYQNRSFGCYAPAHYLKQFLPKYSSEAQVNARARQEGFENWLRMVNNKKDWNLNPELPVLGPWRTVRPINTPTWVMERNPFYYAVDTEGNQLPYINQIVMTLAEDLEVLNLRAMAGSYDLQERHIDIAKLPVILENRERGNYDLHLDLAFNGSDSTIHFNQSYTADPEIAKWLTNADFRRALSLGIDRNQMNETFWLGLGTPGSVVCTEESPYNPGREFRKLWSTHDPKNASAMLDKIGLNKKDGEGYRLRTDGKGRLRLELTTYVGFMPFTQIAEMIKLQWAKIGIQADVSELERSLLNSRRANNETQISMEIMWGTENMYAHSPVNLFPYDPTSAVGPLYGRWFATGGSAGKTPPGRLKELLQLYREGFSAPEKQHYELGKKIWRIAIEEQYVIGTVGLAPGIMGLRVVKNSIGNVPGRMFNGSSTLHPKQSKPETAFYKKR
jgi:peptide/nickel transport system substrate-binding protein